VFLINVPLGIFGTLWGISRLREPVRLPTHQNFDWLGSLTFVVGLGSLPQVPSRAAGATRWVRHSAALWPR
jgi:hypothetical protein